MNRHHENFALYIYIYRYFLYLCVMLVVSVLVCKLVSRQSYKSFQQAAQVFGHEARILSSSEHCSAIIGHISSLSSQTAGGGGVAKIWKLQF